MEVKRSSIPQALIKYLLSSQSILIGLHITFGKALTSVEVSEYRRRIERRKAYEVWEKQAWRTLADYLWLMRAWRELAPKSPDDEPDRRFIYALHHLDYAEYLCSEFIDMDKTERIDMKSIIYDIADFMKKAVHKAPP